VSWSHSFESANEDPNYLSTIETWELINLPRSIIHLDADAFFASVEQASDTRLRGKAIAVGGEKRGIIASASYEARKFGIYTPMPTVMARRLCPKLILVPGDFEKYEHFSRLMFSYAYDFTPDVEIGSIDEGYLDLTSQRRPAFEIAQTIKKAIHDSLHLPVSEGVGPNKLISQIASKLRKPAALELVAHGNETTFLAPLANKWLPGIGPKTANQLNAAGLARIGQIAHTPPDLLQLLVGNMAVQLRNYALGIDDRPVIPIRAPAKSYGEQETFSADTTDEPFLEATLRRMADKLMAKVREDGKSIRTLTVKIRYNDMDEDQAAESLDEPIDLETDIYSNISRLLRKAWKRRVSLRLVSLRLSNLYDGRFRSSLGLDVSARRHEAEQRLADVADALRERFGRAVLLRGHDFTLRIFHAEKNRNSISGARNSFRLNVPEGRHENRVNGHCESPTPEGTAEQRKAQPSGDSYGKAVLHRQRLGHYAATRLPNKTVPLLPQERGIYSTSPQNETDAKKSSLNENTAGYHVSSKDPQVVELLTLKRNEFRAPIEAPTGSVDSRLQPPPIPQSAIRNPQSSYSPGPELKFRSVRTNATPRIPDVSAAPFIPLNVHSHFSFLDSTLSPAEIVALAWRHKFPAIALTDKNNLHGAVEFAQAAAQSGVKAVIGAEIVFNGSRVCLYVQNQTGYANLCGILNNPKSPNLAQTDGLLALSPNPNLAALFPDRFYVEIDSIDVFAKYLAAYHRQSPGNRPLPCIGSFPAHYDLQSDRWKYDIVQSIRTLTLLRQQHPEKRLDGDFHFRLPLEMRQAFAAHPELLSNSIELAERCNFEFSIGTPQFPGFHPPHGLTPARYLRNLVMEGLHRRYPNADAGLKAQLEEELAIILDVGYEEYFLVMWDILQECRRRGIEWITRGSAADSLACYCLEISGVCPIRFDLYFRRFLNKDRMALNKLPDIDVDFPHDRKDDVIDLIFEKYGAAQTAIVGGFSTFRSRSAFAEVAKVLGVSEFQVRRITERLPHFTRAAELTEAVAASQECRDLPLHEEPYSTALQMAYFLDGFPRYPKMHPCGLVLSRQPMREVTPCFISAKGYPTTHFDMDSVEAIGLIKMDILAQGGLAVMRDVQQMLSDATPETLFSSQERGIHAASVTDIPLNRNKFRAPMEAAVTAPSLFDPASPSIPQSAIRIPQSFDDPSVWSLIANGHARAVHHIESPAMISLCKMCNVRDIDTLIAIVSVIRPGAANENNKMEFARRYQGLRPAYYPHPSLERCLRSTFGLVVYEEHILQICEAFAHLPPGRADVLRRALAKDRAEIIDEIKQEFFACARKEGPIDTKIQEVWDIVTSFKGYAFCKAHSTAYGVEAYQSAWLKRYYPAEFMAAVLSNGKGFYSPLVYVLECHRLGFPLRPPSINNPGPQFTVVRSNVNGACASIRVPALNVKGLTQRTKNAITREHAKGCFTSLHDFFLRVHPLNEEMEALIQAGAFDEFGKSRTTQYWQFKANAQSADGKLYQPWLLPPANLDRLPAVPLAEPDRLQCLRWEEELLGYPVSGHPLELFDDIDWNSYCPINQLAKHIGQKIVTCGLVIEQRLFHQVTGEPMKFITIADWTGMIETELFAQTYKSYGLNTIRYRVLEITATVEPFENSRGYTLRVFRAGKARTTKILQARLSAREENSVVISA
jgi:DNA-directed DNA polymerase III PolC